MRFPNLFFFIKIAVLLLLIPFRFVPQIYFEMRWYSGLSIIIMKF